MGRIICLVFLPSLQGSKCILKEWVHPRLAPKLPNLSYQLSRFTIGQTRLQLSASASMTLQSIASGLYPLIT